MHLRFPLLFALLTATADAKLGTHVLSGVSQAHRQARDRSAGLARDLRRALSGILAEQQVLSVQPSCGLGNNANGNGSGLTGGSPTSPASSAGGSPSATGSGSASPSSTASSSPWKVQQDYSGDSFFDGWTFFTAADPTDGTVNYVDYSTAQSTNLTSINSAGNAIMRVDTTPVISGNRNSVRITTNYTYTEALVVLDAVHMPTGCGTWPAFWSNGPNWPAGGEIDIVEGVNAITINQATIHTNPGCTIASSNGSQIGATGTVVGGTNCAAAESGNAGCGMQDPVTTSYGSGFNGNGGGVFAMQWIDSGISVWFFPRSSIPTDIASGAPQPSGWGTPFANWPATDCNPQTFFYDHSAIFDTTLCGEWAGNVWGSSGSPGQEQSCQATTGVATCAEYVQNNGAAFADAYWEVKSVKIYQT